MPIVILGNTSRAIVDKADMGCIISRVEDKEYQSISGKILDATADGKINHNNGLKPTHVIDIYKMRRGQYKNVRIWCKIDLGTGQRMDLYMTRMDNEPISHKDIFLIGNDTEEVLFPWRDEYEKPIFEEE